MFFAKLFSKPSAADLYVQAKELAKCLYGFPYQNPTDVPRSVSKDKKLMAIIKEAYKTTIKPDGNTQQTTISAAERIEMQAAFKERIYLLLEKCLELDSEYGPTYLLYPKVAEYNTRAGDRKDLIALFEKLRPTVEAMHSGTNAYSLIKDDISNLGGNYFNKVERHLADFHIELSNLYEKEKQIEKAETEYEKASNLLPELYKKRESDEV